MDADLKRQLVSNPLFTPGWIPRSISRINSRMGLGSGGRPRFRDFQRQNIRNADLCHLMNASGLTTTSASRQSKKRANAIIARRAVRVMRRGFTLRSLKSASCLRRNRFSAIKAVRGNKRRRRRVSNRNSTSRSAIVTQRPYASLRCLTPKIRMLSPSSVNNAR